MGLGDKTRAWKHLLEGGRLLNSQDHRHWLRWRFNIRFELELANYYFATGDLVAARNAADRALLLARNASARKHVARALLMLSDIARIEERSDDAVRNAKRALIILRRYPCPMIEWRAALSAAGAAAMAGERQSSEEFTRQSLAVRRGIADSIRDERLRETFLRSQDAVPISEHKEQRRASF
jgi:tetratricopeptide (TPR) repeat protein